jgi:hypothetical protein
MRTRGVAAQVFVVTDASAAAGEAHFAATGLLGDHVDALNCTSGRTSAASVPSLLRDQHGVDARRQADHHLAHARIQLRA